MAAAAAGPLTRAALAAACLLLAGCAAAPVEEPGPADEGPAAAPTCARVAAPGTRCFACQAGLGAEAWRWSDGRLACDGCHAEAVVSLDEARALLRQARDDLRRVLSIRAPEVSLALVDRARLDLRAGQGLQGPSLLAMTSHDADLPDEPARLDLLWGLPRGALRGILAHELFHAHQLARLHAAGTRDVVEPAFVEAAALHVHRRVLLALGETRWAARVAPDDDPGLRRFEALVRSVGEPRALELAATTTRFPPGH